MNFSDALDCLKIGKKAYRTGWNGKNQHVSVIRPDGTSRIDQPYLCLLNEQRKIFPWFPSTGDLFAEDWELIQ